MSVVLTTPYHPPVDQLLTLGDIRVPGWPDYGRMGFGPEHVPELIRMSSDPELNEAGAEEPEVWASIHAWRVLGMLRAEEAIEPLIALFPDLGDYDRQEVPRALGRIGARALPPLAAYLADESRGQMARIAAADSLKEVGEAHPESRLEVIAILAQALENEDDGELAGFLVCELLDLRAVEAASALERAFAEDRVAVGIPGDWEDVQVALGLLPHRLTPKPRYQLPGMPDFTRVFASMDRLERESFESDGWSREESPEQARAKAAREKRKQQKEARKKNRRRKR